MSWVCEYCSTSNDDHDTVCFVCGKERSVESIREAKRIAAEEKSEHICEITYKCATLVGKIFFILTIVLFSVMILVLLFQKMRSGTLDDVLSNGIVLGENIAENFKLIYSENISSIMVQIGNSPVYNVSNNAKAMWSSMIDDFNSLFESILTLVNNIGKNISIVIQNIEDVVQKVIAKY